MGLAYGTQDQATNRGHKDHPLIGQWVGEDPPYAVTERARIFERAQKMGMIPTIMPGVSQQSASAAYGGIPLAGRMSQVFNAFDGFGGAEVPPEAPQLPPNPSGQQPGNANQNNPYGMSPDLYGILQWTKDQKETTAEFKEKLNAFEDFAQRRAQQQQKFGLQSNLVGFALKELPRMLTEPARRRNRYLDDLVLGVQNQRLAADALTGGQSIGNYQI
tara:strand:+ start:184 stop:834 length:651 start_codon:yes stop_codon:yes gene_type:complete